MLSPAAKEVTVLIEDLDCGHLMIGHINLSIPPYSNAGNCLKLAIFISFTSELQLELEVRIENEDLAAFALSNVKVPLVIKSHGSASVLAFKNAINEAIFEVEKNIPERIREQVTGLLKESEQSL